MKDLSLHILDIAENSINAGATEIRIRIVEDIKENLLLIEISDNGRGMDDETLKKVCDPFFTTKACKRTGLGLPLLAQSAKECCGDLTIRTAKGSGTTISAAFQYDHIDRKPLGDMTETLIVLIASHPEIDFIYKHRKNESAYIMNTALLREELDGIPMNSPEVIKFIKDDINAWLNQADNMIQ
ncbi:MAG: ATP-binding protein [Nitrospiraceae bacterium]|nr:MAG: ATP-binding protein [Nitrospiraceae bacterium]